MGEEEISSKRCWCVKDFSVLRHSASQAFGRRSQIIYRNSCHEESRSVQTHSNYLSMGTLGIVWFGVGKRMEVITPPYLVFTILFRQKMLMKRALAG